MGLWRGGVLGAMGSVQPLCAVAPQGCGHQRLTQQFLDLLAATMDPQEQQKIRLNSIDQCKPALVGKDANGGVVAGDSTPNLWAMA